MDNKGGAENIEVDDDTLPDVLIQRPRYDELAGAMRSSIADSTLLKSIVGRFMTSVILESIHTRAKREKMAAIAGIRVIYYPVVVEVPANVIRLIVRATDVFHELSTLDELSARCRESLSDATFFLWWGNSTSVLGDLFDLPSTRPKCVIDNDSLSSWCYDHDPTQRRTSMVHVFVTPAALTQPSVSWLRNTFTATSEIARPLREIKSKVQVVNTWALDTYLDDYPPFIERDLGIDCEWRQRHVDMKVVKRIFVFMIRHVYEYSRRLLDSELDNKPQPILGPIFFVMPKRAIRLLYECSRQFGYISEWGLYGDPETSKWPLSHFYNDESDGSEFEEESEESFQGNSSDEDSEMDCEGIESKDPIAVDFWCWNGPTKPIFGKVLDHPSIRPTKLLTEDDLEVWLRRISEFESNDHRLMAILTTSEAVASQPFLSDILPSAARSPVQCLDRDY